MPCVVDNSLYGQIEQDLEVQSQKTLHTAPIEQQQEWVKQKVQQKISSDARSVEKENSGALTYVGPEFTLNEKGNIYYPEYDASLDELFARQEKYRASDCDSKEKAASLLMQQAFKDGAREVVMPSWYVNKETGKQEIRDIIIMRWDGTKGTSEIHNIAPDNNFLSLEQAKERIQERFKKVELTEPIHDVYIFSDTVMNKAETSAIVHTVEAEFVERKQLEVRLELKSLGDTRKEHIEAPRDAHTMPLMKDRQVAISTLAFAKTEQGKAPERKYIPPFFAKLVDGIMPIAKEIPKKKPEEIVPKAIKTEQVSTVSVEKKGIGIKKKEKKVKREKKVLYASEISIRESVISGRSEKKKKHEKKIKEHVSKKHRNPETVQIEKEKKKVRKEKRKLKSREQKIKKKEIPVTKEVRQKTKKERKEKKERKRKEALRSVVKKVLKELRRIEKKKQKITPYPKEYLGTSVKTDQILRRREKQTHQLIEKQTTIHFIIALILWRVMYAKGEEKEKMSTLVLSKSKEEKQNNLGEAEETEQTPWVLFSIVWYMTMVREQGKRQQPKKKKKRTENLSGIVYSYEKHMNKGEVFVL